MSLISLTVHWVDSDTNGLCSAVLQVKKGRGLHNRATIAASITEMLNHWEIRLEKVYVILRDNVSNMKAAMEDVAVPSMGCFAHTPQLVVHEGLMSQCSVSDVLANSRNIVGHFKLSQLTQSRLEEMQHEMHGIHPSSSCSKSSNKMEQLLLYDQEPSEREVTSLCISCQPQLTGNTVSQRVGFAGKKQ